MKQTITISDFSRYTENSTIYIDNTGQKYIGPIHQVVAGYTYAVEVAERAGNERFPHILKFLGPGRNIVRGSPNWLANNKTDREV